MMIMELFPVQERRKMSVFDTFTMDDLTTMRKKRKIYADLKPKPKFTFKIVSL